MTSLCPAVTTTIPYESWGQTDIGIDRERIWEVGVLLKTEIKQIQICQPSFLSLVGVIPTPEIAENLSIKVPLALFLSSVFSVWISNFSLLGVFALLSITNFIISLVWDKTENYRIKISRLIADFVLVAVVTTFTELILGKIQIPFTQLNISVLAIGLYLMILSYLVLISKRLIPLTSLVQSKMLKNFLLSCKVGIDDFKERQDKEILPKN